MMARSQETELSAAERLALKNRRAGLALFQISWIMVFVALSIVNLSIRSQSETWPPPGVVKLGVLLPTAGTLVLLVSAWTMRQSLQAIRAGTSAVFQRWLRWTLLLGVVFVGLMLLEWVSVPTSGQYSNVFRVLVGFHMLHAVAIGVYLVYLLRRAERYNPVHFWPVESGAGLWYFVVVAWLLFYTVLYII